MSKRLIKQLVAALNEAREYLPDREWIGGTENGYWRQTGEARLGVGERIDAALAAASQSDGEVDGR